MSPAELEGLREQGAIVLDVRSATEFAAGHIDGAEPLDVDRIAEEIQAKVPNPSTPVVTYGNAGGLGADPAAQGSETPTP